MSSAPDYQPSKSDFYCVYLCSCLEQEGSQGADTQKGVILRGAFAALASPFVQVPDKPLIILQQVSLLLLDSSD